MSQGHSDNTAAQPNLAEPAVETTPKRSYRVAWMLGALAVCLYLGSIVWFYLTRGAA